VLILGKCHYLIKIDQDIIKSHSIYNKEALKMSLNQCNFIGNVGRIKTKELSSGASLTEFSLAVNKKYTDKSGEKHDETEWVNCKAWGKQSETLEKYVSKGSKLFVSGNLKTRSWEGDQGKQYRTEIIVNIFEFLDSKGTRGGQSESSQEGNSSPEQSSFVPENSPHDDDIPF